MESLRIRKLMEAFVFVGGYAELPPGGTPYNDT